MKNFKKQFLRVVTDEKVIAALGVLVLAVLDSKANSE
jgi:hypothetical protein